MSHAYRCVFSPAAVSYLEAIERLPMLLEAGNLDFTGSISRVDKNLGFDLAFYVDEGHNLATGLRVSSFKEAVEMSQDWPGLSFLCLWQSIMKATGNPELGEVDFYIGRDQNDRALLAFDEDRAVNDVVAEAGDLQEEFFRFLLLTCRTLGIDACMFGSEVSLEDLEVTPESVFDILKAGRFPDGNTIGSAVLRCSAECALALHRQFETSGRRIVYSVSGYALLRLEAIDR